MKNYISLTLFFILFFNITKGQVTGLIDTVFINGYIIKEVSKGDVLSYQKSAKRRQKEHKSFDLPIDIHERYLFAPMGGKKSSLSQVIDSLNNSKLLQFFTFCPVQKPYTIYKEICNTEWYKSFECQTPELNSSKYYKIKGYKHKLYELYYVEGEWLKVNYNPKMDYLSSSFKVELIDTRAEYIDLYYLINYIKFKDSPEINDNRIKKWK